MIPLSATTPIVLAREPADFRAGIDGFVARCHEHLQQDPRSGTLYVFINRRATMIRILAYEHNGYWLMTKRLSQGRYRGWPRDGQTVGVQQAAEHGLALSEATGRPGHYPAQTSQTGGARQCLGETQKPGPGQ